MPRASLRSVLLICAFSTARMCRVSTQITGKFASPSELNNHCDSGPASSPIRLKQYAVAQYLQQIVGLARNLNLPNDLARIIHNADARVLDRYVQSSKIVHAALLLMLGALTTVTPFHHQPEAQHPKIFQLSTSRRPITPSLRGQSGHSVEMR